MSAHPPGASAPYRLRTLGALELTGPDGPLLCGRRKVLVLLAYLARSRSHTLRRAELAALLWGDRPEARALSSLREALFQLRGALGDALRSDRHSVTLDAEAVRLDVEELEAALAADQPERVVELWGGTFLPELEDVGTGELRNWIDRERAGLTGAYSAALETLVRSAEERGDWQGAVSWAERWVEAVPMSITAGEALERVLRLAGRTAEVSKGASTPRDRLRAQPGVEGESPEAVLKVQSNGVGVCRDRAGSAALFTPDMVGREELFGELVAAWRSVEERGSAAVLLRGDQGIGKTRLAGEFLAWLADSSSALILRAQAYEAEEATPYAAASTLLRGLQHAPGLSGAPDPALAELAELVPGIRERFRRLPAATGEAEALTEALRRVMEDVAVEVPVLVFLDDVDRADAPSRLLMLALARHLPPSCLLLLSGRPDDLARRDPAEQCEASGVRILTVDPLGLDECEAMLASMVPMEANPRRALATILHAESAGNPFFIEEMVSTLVDERHLVADQRGLWRTARSLDEAPLPLPASVASAVHRRLARLDPPARDTALAAAVLWPLVTPELLHGAAGLSPTTLAAGVDELISRKILRGGLDAPDSYRFAHELLRRVAYEEVPPHRRAEIHRSAARLLASKGGSCAPVARALAYHRDQAGAPLLTDSRPRRRMWSLAGVGAVLVLVVAWLVPGISLTEAELPLVSVGEIREYVGDDSPPTAAAVQGMLGTNLARVEGLRVVSTSRSYELAMRAGDPRDPGPAFARAGLAAGADQLIEGALQRTPSGAWSLDLQVVELATGVVRHAVTVEADNVFALVDRATAQLARGMGLVPPPLRLAQVTTNSLEGYRLYEEGLRRYYLGDRERAAALFEAALREDSAFVMAAFYAGRSLVSDDPPAGLAHLQRAMTLADRAGDRERLIVRGTWMDLLDEPAAEAYADTLLARFPDDPVGYYLSGRVRLRQGDFLGAVSVLRAAMVMDSASASAPGRPCSACDAASQVVAAYWLADSLQAAERAAREWIELQPGAGPPRTWLSYMLEHQSRFDEALAARRQAGQRLTFTPPADLIYPALVDLKRENFDEADRLLLTHIRAGPEDVVRSARWLYGISLRWQGRLYDALEVAMAYRGAEQGGGTHPPPTPSSRRRCSSRWADWTTRPPSSTRSRPRSRRPSPRGTRLASAPGC
jgi:DNA-binding SARP family transcriptional activator/tetratricopeptide (TPR) repeat protein